jgi:hypothetical protein
MAYSDSQQEILLVNNLALQTAANKGQWSPGLLPVTVRGIAATVTTATTAADPAILSFDKRITAGSDTGKVVGGVGILTIPGGTVQGRTVYKLVNVTLDFGQEVVVALTDATAAGAAHVCLYVEPDWENPLNSTACILSA